jgi:hypothetical protein
VCANKGYVGREWMFLVGAGRLEFVLFHVKLPLSIVL